MLVGPVGRLPVLVLPPPLGARCANPGMHKARRIKAAKLERLERYINVLLRGEMAQSATPVRAGHVTAFHTPNHANLAPQAGQNGHPFLNSLLTRLSMETNVPLEAPHQFSTEFALL